MENSFLIVGLGNPGREYARTRHNTGFRAVEQLAERWKASWSAGSGKSARLARLARVDKEGCKVLLCQPQTFMNASGEAVSAVVAFHKILPERILVVVDDADLPLGEIRLRAGGSSGGHHGLESIAQHLATVEFARQRIGIGRKDDRREITPHVLSPFSKSEFELLEKVLTRAGDQIECWVREGLTRAMNQFNGKTKGIT